MTAYLVVAIIGLFVGVAELVSRYRDEPVGVIVSGPAGLYAAINLGCACLALYLTDVFHWRFGLDPEEEETIVRATQVMVSGLAAMALFRSSLFNIRVGEGTVGIGPSGVLQVLLDAADRAVDRNRASPRAARVAEITKGVSFEKAQESLPSLCFALMQNLDSGTQEAVGTEIRALAGSSISDAAKVLLLGLSLMNVVGEDVLKSAVDTLGPEIR
jgi:hypothetical protein